MKRVRRQPSKRRRVFVVTRRNFLASASAAIVWAPPVVRVANLMPLRGIVLSPAAFHFGYCERLSVHLHLPKITQLQNEGLSLRQIASELNRRGPEPWVDGPWDLQFVISILKRDEQIKQADKYLRLRPQAL
jgi:hypothetical protein